MKEKRVRVPKLCQRTDGRLYVTDPATGRQVPMPDQAAYERWRTAFVAAAGAPTPQTVRPGASIGELLDAYMTHAESYYVKRGQPTSQLRIVHLTVRAVVDLWGAKRNASTIRPGDVEALQRRLVAQGMGRETVNRLVVWTVKIWRWGVSREAVDGATVERMRSIEPLRKGRTAAPDYPKVAPADVEHIAAVLKVVKPMVAAMIELQRLGGARPGEICALRPCDLDRTDAVWLYTVHPDWDKTAHHRGDGSQRLIRFGPQAQAILAPLLAGADPNLPLFVGRGGRKMTESGYAKRIRLACDRHGVPRLAPNRLRHSRATEIRKRYGLDAARAYLGHEDADSTIGYAERDDDVARRIAAEIG